MTFQEHVLVGRLGRDPELKYTQTGVAVCDFPLAVDNSYTNKEGQRIEQTTWFRVTCWNKLAEVAAEHLAKGRQVLITSSKIEANAYLGNDGEPRASLDVTASTLRFLGNRNDASPQGESNQQQRPQRQQRQAGYSSPPPTDDSGDIPF